MNNKKFALLSLSLLSSFALLGCQNNPNTSSSSPTSESSSGETSSPIDSSTSSTSSDSYSIISEDEATGGLVYDLSEDGTYYIISDYLSVEYDIVVPSYYDGLPVREIGETAFQYATIDSLLLPSSIKKIGKQAFLGLSADSKLATLTLPEGLEEIDDEAFDYCPSITEVYLPSTLKTLGDRVFHLCSSLRRIRVDSASTTFKAVDNVLYSADQKTLYCYPQGLAFTTFDLPASVEVIKTCAFYGNSNITGIGIPTDSNLKEIEFRGMAAMFSLTTLRLERATKLETLGEKALSENSAIVKVTLPSSVTSLGEGLFYKCSSLQTIELNCEYTSIPASFAESCSKLVNFELANTVTSIGDDAFASCNSLTAMTLPSSLTSLGAAAFDGCSSLKSIVVPEGVTTIGDNTFESCRALTSVSLPSTITSIGNRAFSGCSTLTTLDFSSSKVTSLGASAFMNCSALTTIKLPNTITEMGDYCFEFDTSLKYIRLPDSLTTIGESCFFDCSSLIYVYLPSAVKSIGSVAFRTTYATTGTVNLYFQADSFTNANTEVGTNFTNGSISYSKTEADFNADVEAYFGSL